VGLSYTYVQRHLLKLEDNFLAEKQDNVDKVLLDSHGCKSVSIAP